MKKIMLLLLIPGVMLASCNTQTNKQSTTDNKTENKMKTIELTKADFLSKVYDYESDPNEWKYVGDKPAIIDFYASWCGPCKTIAPILEELADEYKDQIYIYKVNTDKEKELAAAFGIRGIPALLFIPMEKQPQLIQGAIPKSSFVEAIDQVLLNNANQQ